MPKKNAVSPQGARLLRRVAKHILAEPLRYEQNEIMSVGKPGEVFKSNHLYPACGTVACIGGWVELLTTKNPKRLLRRGYFLSYKKISRLLGVAYDDVERLVSYTRDGGWPDQYEDAYRIAKTPRGRARVAANRIEHFIKTGE
jgi:hypothetical protein